MEGLVKEAAFVQDRVSQLEELSQLSSDMMNDTLQLTSDVLHVREKPMRIIKQLC